VTGDKRARGVPQCRMSEMWNSVAGAWDQQADFVDAYLAAPTDALLGAAGIGPGSKVIELACGPGGAGIAAARWVGGAGRVVLADVAPGMVESLPGAAPTCLRSALWCATRCRSTRLTHPLTPSSSDTD